MNINIDELREKLYSIKSDLNMKLNEDEEKEISIFIEGILKDLQKKYKKIDIVNLTKKLNNYYLKEK